jgi:ABC-type transport system involved in multi-copper enzyme maturation permease subunit
MRELIRLEQRKNTLSTYLKMSAWVTVGVVAMTWTFALSAGSEPPGSEEAAAMSSYVGLANLAGVISMAAFCVLSAAMHAKFTVEEYSGNRAVLTLSCPAPRKKVLAAKVVLVSGFTLVAAALSSLASLAVFLLTEAVFPVVHGPLEPHMIIPMAADVVVMSLLAVALGLLGLAAGFWKRSTPVTIITAIVAAAFLSSLASNLAKYADGHALPAVAVTAGVAIAAAFALTRWISGTVESMEAA